MAEVGCGLFARNTMVTFLLKCDANTLTFFFEKLKLHAAAKRHKVRVFGKLHASFSLLLDLR
jgi:hypothetical protein